MAFTIGATVYNVRFGNLEPAQVSGPPQQVQVTNKEGRTFDVVQQEVVTLRHTLPDPETGEIRKYLDVRPQSLRFLWARPIDGTVVLNPVTHKRETNEPVIGLDYDLDEDGQKVALSIDDLQLRAAMDVAAWQMTKGAQAVDLQAL